MFMFFFSDIIDMGGGYVNIWMQQIRWGMIFLWFGPPICWTPEAGDPELRYGAPLSPRWLPMWSLLSILGPSMWGGLAVGTVMDWCCRKIWFHPSKKWDVEKRSNVSIYIFTVVHFLEMCKCCRPLETTGSVFYWTFFPMEATKKWEVHHLGVDHQVVHSWQQRIERRMIMKKRIGCLLPYSL